jgi:hypothetical protein
MIEIRRVLCPIDFSDHSKRALDHAMAIAGGTNRCLSSSMSSRQRLLPPSGPDR